ncbi:MAG: hypothetical protein RLZZ558_561 [Planctomycetota bacterium]
MRNNLLGVCSAVASVAMAGSAMASWTKTYDFNDSASWTGNATTGSWSNAGFGGGFVGRSFNSADATSSYTADGYNGTGGMRYQSTSNSIGGMRLALNGTATRGEFRDAMHKSWNPSVSVKFRSDAAASGMPIFYTYAVASGDPLASGNGQYVDMRLDVDYNGGEVYAYDNDSYRGAIGTGPDGWYEAKMTLLTTGFIEFRVNGTLVGTSSSTYEYLANATDSAMGIYSSPTLWNTGPVDVTFDDFVITSAIPAPGAVALLGLAGLAGGRRRRN